MYRVVVCSTSTVKRKTTVHPGTELVNECVVCIEKSKKEQKKRHQKHKLKSVQCLMCIYSNVSV